MAVIKYRDKETGEWKDLLGNHSIGSTTPSGDCIIEGYYYRDGQENSFFASRFDNGGGNYIYSNKITGQTRVIYIDLITNDLYRWNDSEYIKISSSTDERVSLATDDDILALFKKTN